MAFVFGMILSFGQGTKPVVKSADKDTLTINVISENPKVKQANDNLAIQLARSVDNQSVVTNELASSIRHVSAVMSEYIMSQQVNNMSPPVQSVVLQTFGFTSEKIKKSIKRQNAIKSFYLFIGTVYLAILFGFRTRSKIFSEFNMINWVFAIKEGLKGSLIFYGLYLLTTFIINPAYLDIVALSKLLL